MSGAQRPSFDSRRPIHLPQGQIYERPGDRRRAAEHYGLFLDLWERCDPALPPLVDETRARLAHHPGDPR